MYKKILVPLDGSATSERGFEEALALASALKSELLLLHVIDTTPVAIDMVTAAAWTDVGEAYRQHGQALLDRALERAKAKGLDAQCKLVESRLTRVADNIVDEARSGGCDLVLMGTHGRRGFSHLLLGSDAERVLRQCTVPVLLLRHPDAPVA